MQPQVKPRFSTPQKHAATNSRDFRTFLLVAQFEAREIGARIAQARKEQGMNQDDLAALSSFSKRSLQDYENGVTIPYKHLRELGRLLDKDTDWFLRGDPTPATESDADDLAARVEARMEAALNNQAKVLRAVEELARAVDGLTDLVEANLTAAKPAPQRKRRTA